MIVNLPMHNNLFSITDTKPAPLFKCKVKFTNTTKACLSYFVVTIYHIRVLLKREIQKFLS